MPTKLELVEAKTKPGDDLDHWSCCEDKEGVYGALCGIDLSGHNLVEMEVASCTVCEMAAEGNYCPKYGKCK